jgi:hypothetical protein
MKTRGGEGAKTVVNSFGNRRRRISFTLRPRYPMERDPAHISYWYRWSPEFVCMWWRREGSMSLARIEPQSPCDKPVVSSTELSQPGRSYCSSNVPKKPSFMQTKVHYLVHKSPKLDPILSQISPIHTLAPLVLSLISSLGLSHTLCLPLGFPHYDSLIDWFPA